MRYFVLSTILLLGTNCFSQIQHLRFQVGTNYSINSTIRSDVETVETSFVVGQQTFQEQSSVEESFKPYVGFTIGASPEIMIANKLNLLIGLRLDYLRFKRETRVIMPEQEQIDEDFIIGRPIGNGGLFFDREVIGSPEGYPVNVYFLSVPIGLSYNFTKKLSVNVTGDYMRRIYSQEDRNEVSFSTETFSYELERVTWKNGENLNPNGLKFSVNINYDLIAGIGVIVGYDRSFTSIYSEEFQYAGKARYQFIRVGLSWFLEFN